MVSSPKSMLLSAGMVMSEIWKMPSTSASVMLPSEKMFLMWTHRIGKSVISPISLS